MELEKYLQDIRKIKLLSPEEEKELAKRSKKGDKKARERLIEANLRLVVNIAKKYTNKGVSFQDLIEEGNLGLLKAVEKFDPDLNFRFSTYATWWIKQSIIRAINENSKIVKIPSYMKEVLLKAEDIANKIKEKKGYTPSLEEIAQHLSEKEKKILLNKNTRIYFPAIFNIQSLDKIYEQRETVEDPNAQKDLFTTEEIERLDVLLSTLDEKRRKILKLRFGIGGEGPLTLQEISKRVKLSRERVRQIIKETLAKLREIIENENE